MLHIVEFVDSLDSGGAQVLMGLRARHAERLGYRIDVISLDDGNAEEQVFLDNNVRIHRFPSQHVFKFSRLVAICRLLRRLQPDVIHTHLRTSNIVGTLCGRLCGVPVVNTLHNIFPESDLAHARRDWAERWCLRLFSSEITAVGPTVAETQASRFDPRSITVVPNPVEIPASVAANDPNYDAGSVRRLRSATNADLGLPWSIDNAPVILVVGRLTRTKGFPECIYAIERLRDQVPDVRLLIAGNGPLHDDLQSYIHERELGNNIALLGRCENISELMLAADVFLLTSQGEGLPLVVLEAMAHRLPVVASAVGDVPWLLKNGRAGRLVSYGDIEATAHQISELLAEPETAAKMADVAWRRVREDFSVDGWLDSNDRLYRKICKRKKNFAMAASNTNQTVDGCGSSAS